MKEISVPPTPQATDEKHSRARGRDMTRELERRFRFATIMTSACVAQGRGASRYLMGPIWTGEIEEQGKSPRARVGGGFCRGCLPAMEIKIFRRHCCLGETAASKLRSQRSTAPRCCRMWARTDTIRHDTTPHGTIRYDTTRYDTIRRLHERRFWLASVTTPSKLGCDDINKERLCYHVGRRCRVWTGILLPP